MGGLLCAVTWHLEVIFPVYSAKQYLVNCVYAALLLPSNSTANVCEEILSLIR